MFTFLKCAVPFSTNPKALHDMINFGGKILITLKILNHIDQFNLTQLNLLILLKLLIAIIKYLFFTDQPDSYDQGPML